MTFAYISAIVQGMRWPQTTTEARALPEVASPHLEPISQLQSDGTTITHFKIRPLCAGVPREKDDILLFIDTDGESKQVVMTEDGPVKSPRCI